MTRRLTPPWWLSTLALIVSIGLSGLSGLTGAAGAAGAAVSDDVLTSSLLTFGIFAAVHAPVWLGWRAYQRRRRHRHPPPR